MNNQEKSILEVVANDVKWIKSGLDEMKEEFKCQVKTCNQRMDNQDKKISDNMRKIFWILGILAACGVTGGTIFGVLQ